ncbi:MAG: hypothetical protein JSV09_05535 [Thermoplasmata archaeon]|nr:MAG: hypothetical protein JSV09_05535 [Thermoplasmata archaeon]
MKVNNISLEDHDRISTDDKDDPPKANEGEGNDGITSSEEVDAPPKVKEGVGNDGITSSEEADAPLKVNEGAGENAITSSEEVDVPPKVNERIGNDAVKSSEDVDEHLNVNEEAEDEGVSLSDEVEEHLKSDEETEIVGLTSSKEIEEQPGVDEGTTDKEQVDLRKMYKTKASKIPRKVTLKYIIDIGLLITFSTTFITGLIKFSPLTRFLGVNPRTLPMYEISLLHDYGAIIMGFIILSHLLLNLNWISHMTKRHFRNVNKKKLATRAGVLFVAIIVIALMFQNPAFQRFLFGATDTVIIDGIGDFKYNPDAVETQRPDIFQEGKFSIFDIMVHLNNTGKIRLNYHFSQEMNTHVIESINGKENWWYEAYYDGGWPENNVFRMDHYPYKEKIYIRFYRVSEGLIDKIHNTFRDEIARIKLNKGAIIIPTVIIDGRDSNHRFENVVITPHNLRNDMFQNGTITAIDVIMTLGEEGLISYDLQWYSDIGTAEVKNYFVERINEDKSHDRCGFVYEAGSNQFHGFTGNHIHVPSDIRVINSPEYVEYFWICI